MHVRTHLGCCGYAWVQPFSGTALIISFNEHHLLLFPSAWVSLSTSVCFLLALFLSHTHTHTHTHTLPPPCFSISPQDWSSINAPFHICCTQTGPGSHPNKHTLCHALFGIILCAFCCLCVCDSSLLPSCLVKMLKEMIWIVLTFSCLGFEFFNGSPSLSFRRAS